MDSLFNHYLSEWKPLNLKEKEGKIPYWAEADIEFLPKEIQSYYLNNDLQKQIEKSEYLSKLKI